MLSNKVYVAFLSVYCVVHNQPSRSHWEHLHVYCHSNLDILLMSNPTVSVTYVRIIRFPWLLTTGINATCPVSDVLEAFRALLESTLQPCKCPSAAMINILMSATVQTEATYLDSTLPRLWKGFACELNTFGGERQFGWRCVPWQLLLVAGSGNVESIRFRNWQHWHWGIGVILSFVYILFDHTLKSVFRLNIPHYTQRHS